MLFAKNQINLIGKFIFFNKCILYSLSNFKDIDVPIRTDRPIGSTARGSNNLSFLLTTDPKATDKHINIKQFTFGLKRLLYKL